MNISIMSPQIYPCKTGGVEVFNYHLAKELAKRGHKIWVLTYCEHKVCDSNIHNIILNRKFLINSWFLTNLYIFIKLLSIRKQVDVLYVPYVSNSPFVYSILLFNRLLNKIPYVITIHGGGMHPWKPEFIHRLFFKYANEIVAVSDTIKKEYEKRSGRSIIVIPPLVPFNKSKIPKDKLKMKYGFSCNDTIILSLGSIKKIKGSDILLNAFLRLEEEYIKNHNLKLLFVGDGNLRSELQEKCNKIGLNRYIKFFGSVSYENIPKIYKLADIYVIPSLFEGMPISLLEAMFNGLAIIGSNTVGINNIIKHNENGLLFDRGNIIDLEVKIRKIIENKEEANKLREIVKKGFYKSYNFDNMILEYIKIVKDVCGDQNE